MKNLMVLTTLRIATITSAYRRLVTPSFVCALLLVSACSTTLPLEAPLCVPLRPLLVDIAVEDQLSMRNASPKGFEEVATNDATLKSHVVVLERVIQAHDEPLGSCD